MPRPDQLELVFYPDPVLRTKTQPVTDFDEPLRAIVQRMIEIMRTEDGIGLAAPQAGLPIRLFVCDVPQSDDDPAEIKGLALCTDGPVVCVNPTITSHSKSMTTLDEGCLSLPDVRGDITRPETITMTAKDLDGIDFTIHAAGLLAKCLQHEFDHLEGVLIIDRMSQMGRLKNRTKLRKLKQEQGD